MLAALPERRRELDQLVDVATQGALTLVFGVRDAAHEQARVIADEIERRLRRNRD